MLQHPAMDAPPGRLRPGSPATAPTGCAEGPGSGNLDPWSVFWHSDAKAGALLHALEDKVNTIGALLRHPALPGRDVLFLAHTLFGPLDRQPMIAGESFHPGLVVGGALAEDVFADRGNADDVAEEVHHLLGPRQGAEVTVNDNAVEAVVD